MLLHAVKLYLFHVFSDSALKKTINGFRAKRTIYMIIVRHLKRRCVCYLFISFARYFICFFYCCFSLYIHEHLVCVCVWYGVFYRARA